MNLRDLFTELRVADVQKKTYTMDEDDFEAVSAIVALESMDNSDLIACTVEIPWNALKKYGIDEPTVA